MQIPFTLVYGLPYSSLVIGNLVISTIIRINYSAFARLTGPIRSSANYGKLQ